MNDYYRRMKFDEDIGPEPIVGDKVICLKNDWEAINSPGDALVNGTIGEILAVHSEYDRIKDFTLGRMDFLPETAEGDLTASFTNLPIDWKLITEKQPTITKENWYKFKRVRLEQFDYGYCITAHKSQGSEYPKVLVLEEILKASEHKRWLYTACTRASNKLTLVLKD